MLSYRHAFHAGNHADVLKHLTLVLVLEKLKQKNKPFSYLDTHSGAGMYSLSSEEALKTHEFSGGVGQLSSVQAGDVKSGQVTPNHSGFNSFGLAAYWQLVQASLAKNEYPGSPVIAASLMREQDNLELIELHNTEVVNLKRNLKGDARVHIHHRDGFEGLGALMPPKPPKPARGCVLIDPSYELASDYRDTLKAITTAHKRWATGIFLIWYPLISDRAEGNKTSSKSGQSELMLSELETLDLENLLVAELHANDPALGGMYGSGMAIINAPWQLDEQLKASLEELSEVMSVAGSNDKVDHSVHWLIQGS